MAARFDSLINIVNEIAPATVRQIFYQATILGVVEKTESGYAKVQRALVDLRRAGRVAYGQMVDSTRWMRKPASYTGLEEFLEEHARAYRRDLWADTEDYIEIWCEKDALAGVISPITYRYDVPLMVARGFASITFIQSTAEDIAERVRPAFIYHLGDFDPSGVCAARKIEEGLHDFAPHAEIHFKRLAVTELQIEAWGLPTRPTKMSDTRAKGFGQISVELDAVRPDLLRWLVEDAITQHLDPGHLSLMARVEAEERQQLRIFAGARP